MIGFWIGAVVDIGVSAAVCARFAGTRYPLMMLAWTRME